MNLYVLTANLIQLGVSEMEGLVENTDAFMVSGFYVHRFFMNSGSRLGLQPKVFLKIDCNLYSLSENNICSEQDSFYQFIKKNIHQSLYLCQLET